MILISTVPTREEEPTGKSWFIYFSFLTPTPLPTHVLGAFGKGAFSRGAIRGQTDTVRCNAAESVLGCKAVHRL